MGKNKELARGNAFERKIAKELGIQRRIRKDYSESIDDLYDPRNKHLKFDTKRHKRWSFHTTFKDCERKYCSKTDKMVLITAETGKQTSLVTIDLDFFKELLNRYSQ
jgi:hypothetical protein